MAERIDGWGAGELARELWERFGLPPTWLLNDRTPNEILFLFSALPESPETDRVTQLREANHIRLAGQPPRIPPWLMKEVPRGRSQ